MYTMLEVQLNEMRESGVEVAVLEAAILIEAKWTPLVDEVWVTVASEDTVVLRVQQRNNLAEEEIRRRIRSQLSNEERAEHASVVIENNAGMQELQDKVKDLWNNHVQGRVA
jgi:dephospho-CoA kinase